VLIPHEQTPSFLNIFILTYCILWRIVGKNEVLGKENIWWMGEHMDGMKKTKEDK